MELILYTVRQASGPHFRETVDSSRSHVTASSGHFKMQNRSSLPVGDAVFVRTHDKLANVTSSLGIEPFIGCLIDRKRRRRQIGPNKNKTRAQRATRNERETREAKHANSLVRESLM